MKIINILAKRLPSAHRIAAEARRSGKFVSASVVLRKLARRLDKARKVNTEA